VPDDRTHHPRLGQGAHLVVLAALCSSPSASPRCARRRSMRCRTCRTCRSSSAHPIRGKRPGSSRTRYLSLATTMLSVPGARVGAAIPSSATASSMYCSNDGTDLYWARSRVLEYLSQVQGRLPTGATALDRSRRQPVSAGFTNMRWSTRPGGRICSSSARCRTVPALRA